MTGEIHRLLTTACPACGKMLNAAASWDGSSSGAPRPGDLTVCVQCDAYLAFTETDALHLLSQDEIDALDAETRAELHQTTVMLQKMRSL
jgi:hypothetical protein